ncbi:30S ribosome-binding factor RbfA [Thermosulfuriphilus sp.]
MKGQRAKRVAELLRQELSLILQRGLKDPRLKEAFITVVDAQVSPDLKRAVFFFDIHGSESERQRVLAGLRQAQGHLRRELANRVRLKFMPEIEFELDQSQEALSRIDALLAKAREKDGQSR